MILFKLKKIDHIRNDNESLFLFSNKLPVDRYLSIQCHSGYWSVKLPYYKTNAVAKEGLDPPPGIC